MGFAVQKLSPANNELATKTRYFRMDADVFWCLFWNNRLFKSKIRLLSPHL